MLKIDLYTDIVCPWCIIGQHWLDKVLHERFPDLDVDIEHRPFELHPSAPPEGSKLEDYFRIRGINFAQVGSAFAGPEAEAAGVGPQPQAQPRSTAVYLPHRSRPYLAAARAGAGHNMHCRWR